MPTPLKFSLAGLMPAMSPHLAAAKPVALPFGGPVGVGGGFAQGQALGVIGGAQASAVLTLTMTLNSATGFQGYFTYYGDTVYSGLAVTGGVTANAVSALPTAAQIQAALVAAVPGWSGNLTVTGTGPYTITFNNLMANKMYGGLLLFTVTAYTGGTGPTGAVTITTAGSAGAAQANIYNSSTNNHFDGALEYYTLLDPTGCPVPQEISGALNQPANGVPMWSKGIFFADTTNYPEKSIVGLDANAMTLGKLQFYNGRNLTDAGVMVEF